VADPVGSAEPHPAPPDAAIPEGQVWPPPPAVWEPGPGAGPSDPAEPAGAPGRIVAAEQSQSGAKPGWAAPGSSQARNRDSGLSRWAAAWSRAATGEEQAGGEVRTATGTGTPSNYLWQSLACLFLFLPSALIAILYSAQVNRRVQIGDMTGAIRASRLARTWCLVTVGVFALLVLWLMAGGNAP
jgi:hypothetical protein